MVTRRGFLSALCALPFVGRFLPKPVLLTQEMPLSAFRRMYETVSDDCVTSWDEHIWIASGDTLYHFKDDGTFDADRMWSSVHKFL